MTKKEGEIWLLYLKENGSALSKTINNILYILEAKTNLLSIDQLSKREVDMKTTGARIYLYQREKKVIINSRIDYIWLMNGINWLIRALSACKVVKRALKKSKNNIFYTYLRHIGKINSKKIISMIDDIYGDPTKICFYELYISIKIIRNLSIKAISKVTTKLGKVHIDFWGSFSNISLERNCYIWTATD